MENEKFCEFKEQILKCVQNILLDMAECKLITTRKNNGLILNGMHITPFGSNIGTVIYLENFATQYENGRSCEDLAQVICEIFNENKDKVKFDVKKFEEFELAANNIVYKVINYHANKTFLQTVPHRRVLDLAIVYYYIGDVGADTFASTMIKNEHVNMWNTNESTLYKLARNNTPNLLPGKIQSMQEVLNGVIPFEHGLGDKCLDIMYVLTNEKGINGAACMIYPQVLSDFANRIEEDLFILPSSIHEIIVIPKSMITDIDDIKGLVEYVNLTEVSSEEVLSDTVYCFNRSSGMIEVA